MAEKRVQRRLAAILAADVVGYSRLMGEDETGTLAQLKTLRKEVFDPRITEHNGRIVKTTGDGVLVEFASAVDAIECAIKVQRALARRNEDVPEGSRIELRIGINLGDIIVDGEDIYGDGVNVAARLEGLCNTGEVYVSAVVQNQVEGKIAAEFDDLGDHTVKNIDKPIRVYRVSPEAGPWVTATTAADPDQSLPLPDKPSIAVLPFANMSGDPDQEYFADGIAEDIITALSRFHWFFVIARNSSFSYKGASPDVRQVARDLGVRYVLEGSVRKGGSRLRITAQLIDAQTGRHVWAEQYDRDIEDVFAVQDEITERVAAAVGPEFFQAEMQRAQRKETTSLDGWERLMRGFWHLWHFSKDHNAEARRWFEHAAELDPNSASAFGGMAICQTIDASYGWSDSPERSNTAAVRAARKAVEIDNRSAFAHNALGIAYRNLNRHDDAIAEFERAVELNPNFAAPHGQLGRTLALTGESDSVVPHIENAMRLSPRDPLMVFWLTSLGLAAFVAERYEEAFDWAKKALQENSELPAVHALLVASCGQLDRPREAKAALAGLFGVQPGATLEAMKRRLQIKNAVDLDRFLEGLRKAGVPE